MSEDVLSTIWALMQLLVDIAYKACKLSLQIVWDSSKAIVRRKHVIASSNLYLFDIACFFSQRSQLFLLRASFLESISFLLFVISSSLSTQLPRTCFLSTGASEAKLTQGQLRRCPSTLDTEGYPTVLGWTKCLEHRLP